MLRDLIRLIGASLGLVKDASEAALRGYVGLLKKMAVPSVIALAVSFLLALIAVASGARLFNFMAIAVAGSVAMTWVLATSPFIALGTKLGEFQFLRPTLQFLQFVAGSAFFLSVLALLVPADPTGASRLSLAVVSLVGSVFVFGLARSLLWLRIKVGVILGLMILASLLPRTSDLVPDLLAKVDHFLSGCAGPTELVLTEEALRTIPLFDSRGPRYWCRPALDRDAGYRCYDRPGRDPYNDDELIPINQTIVTDASRRLEEIGSRREAEEVRERPDEAAEIEPPPTARPQLQIERPEPTPRLPVSDSGVSVTGGGAAAPPVPEPTSPTLRAYIATNSTPVHLAIAIAEDSRFEIELMHRVQTATQVGSAGTVSDGVFAESLVAEGLFDRLMAGDRALLESLPRPAADYLALGRARVGAETSGLTQSPVADMSIEMRIIDGRTGRVLAERQFKHRAIGYSSDEALDTARMEIGGQVAKWVRAEMAGL